MNQAYDRLYSDKVSKFVIFGPISNFAPSLQATPLKVYFTKILSLSHKKNETNKSKES